MTAAELGLVVLGLCGLGVIIGVLHWATKDDEDD